jgi:hypothetical protein
MLDSDEMDDELVEVVGTVFLLDEDPDEDPMVGIDTDDEEYWVSEGDFDEILRDLEGEVIHATGTLFVDDEGHNWFHVLSYDLGD